MCLIPVLVKLDEYVEIVHGVRGEFQLQVPNEQLLLFWKVREDPPKRSKTIKL